MATFSLVGLALVTTLPHNSTLLLTLANGAGASPLPNHAPEHPAHRPMSFRRPCFRTQIHEFGCDTRREHGGDAA